MASLALAEAISRMGVVPVIAIGDEAGALALGDALIEGGLPIAEITFRTKAAAKVIQALSRERPAILVGAGTVLTAADLKAAKDAGAGFAFAPGLNPDIVKQAQDLGIVFIPGIATPSELEQALSLGCAIVKFFPAESLGGLEMLSAMSAPYRHTGIKVIPTGGVKHANLEAYLNHPLVLGVGGSWIATTEEIAAGQWQAITAKCQDAAAAVRRIRPLA